MTLASRPAVVRTRDELSAVLIERRFKAVAPSTVGLVPTMGALHEGHRSLLRLARDQADTVLTSVFVNPTQFAPGEDFTRYPRSLDADLDLCADEKVDLVFAPDVKQIYPRGSPTVTVDPGPLGQQLEGLARPGHFRGVLTVVAKLFGLVRPDLAVFGEKDYQQLVLVNHMARDLSGGVRILGGETVREPDGLALSSRNRYLSPDERSRALALYQALYAGSAAGIAGPHAVVAAASGVLDGAGLEPDYLELRAPDLGPTPTTGSARLLVAARVGSTRLIDNLPVMLGDSSKGQEE